MNIRFNTHRLPPGEVIIRKKSNYTWDQGIEDNHMRKNATNLLLSTLAAGLLAASAANAAPVTFYDGTFTSAARAANAKFAQDGTNLIVTLTNTWTGDVLVPVDVLTGVFFTLSGDPTLTRVSALLNTGSTVFYDADGQPSGGVVGGEWAYKDGLAGAPHSADEGISSSGLGLFGPGDRFPGADLQSPTSPNGLEYGLLSAGDNTATGNAGVLDSGGLIKNSVVFTLSGLDATKSYTLSNVSFQWGTNLSEPNETCCTSSGGIPGSGDVPEPGTLSLFGGALLLGSLTYARRRKARASV